MNAFFKHFNLRIVSPSFDSPLTDTLMELNHLRRLRLRGTTSPWIFFQLKNIFQLLESLGSARIEGNRTTISEYVEKKIEKQERSSERFLEISNIEIAMNYIEESITEGTDITNHFIRELHHLTVNGLEREGDKTPGSYRTWNVKISQALHLPPESHLIQGYMDELISFINESSASKYDLLKAAIAHHRFTWIHPFGNGNGRVVRLLMYALLIKYGFNVKEVKLINPSVVFFNDRDRYYKILSEADNGDEESLLSWCDYVLTGLLEEVEKINKLLNFEYLRKNILFPAIDYGRNRGFLNELEVKILKTGIKKQKFRSTDLNDEFKEFSSRQKTHQLSKMRDSRFIQPFEEKGRTYFVNFMNNYLMRGLILTLEKEGFIPPIDK